MAIIRRILPASWLHAFDDDGGASCGAVTGEEMSEQSGNAAGVAPAQIVACIRPQGDGREEEADVRLGRGPPENRVNLEMAPHNEADH